MRKELTTADLLKFYNATTKANPDPQWAAVEFNNFLRELRITYKHVQPNEEYRIQLEKMIEEGCSGHYKLSYFDFARALSKISGQKKLWKFLYQEFLPENIFDMTVDYFKEPQLGGPLLAQAYLLGIREGKIDATGSPEGIALYQEVVSRLLKQTQSSVAPLVGEMINYMLENPQAFPLEVSQRAFCGLIEVHKSIPKNGAKKLNELVEFFSSHDLSPFFSEFKEIRQFYNRDTTGMTFSALPAIKLDFEMNKIGEIIGAKPNIVENNLFYAHSFLTNKALEVPAIQLYQYKCEKKVGKLYIIGETDNNPFLDKMKLLIDLTNEASTKGHTLYSKDIPPLWKSVELYYGLNNNLTTKAKSKTSKKI